MRVKDEELGTMSGTLVKLLRRPRGFPEWTILIALIILLGIATITVSADFLTIYAPGKTSVQIGETTIRLSPLVPPGGTQTAATSEGDIVLSFLMGTDHLGRDVFTRIIFGAKFVLSVAVLSTAMSALVGVPTGLFSGFVGGKIDRVISLVMDSIYAFPGLVLAIGLAALLGPGLINMSVAIAVVYIPSYFRVVRGQTLSVKELPYVEAARALGAKAATTMRRYIFPNVIPSVAVILSLNFADAILTEAGLSFLGLGIPPDIADWGLDLAVSKSFFVSGFWWLGVFPGLMIVITVLAFSLLGEAINEKLSPVLSSEA